MKTKLALTFLLFSFYFLLAESQVPQGFNYQAIVRDGTGNIIPSTSMPVEITLQTTQAGGTVIYKELFSSVSSNSFGLISLVVGTGTQTGGTATSFSAIDWTQTLFLKTAIQYPGPGWTVMGTTQVWAVPYSLQAKNVGPLNKLGITGTTDVMDEALFEVKNKAGNTVFAVYNEGIRAYVGSGKAKGVKGGFSVGGYDAAKSGTVYDIFVLSTDSARFYLDSKPQGVKGVKGGFSVGGYDMTKGGILQNYLDVTPATTKIFTADTTKGFAVGNISKGTAESYLKLTPRNYLIGHDAGKNLTTGTSNSFIGYKAGMSTTSGNYNVFIGERSGYNNLDGWGNTFIGDSAGCKNTTGRGNLFMGAWAGQENTTGYYNVSIGASAGALSTEGIQNINIGVNTGALTTTGTRNTNIGSFAGQNNKTGSYNISLGNYAGFSATAGDGNTYLGSYAGRNNLSGNWNVCIGYAAGRDETGSQRLYIANSATSTNPLIYGEFDNARIVINGNAASNTLGNNLFVNGSAAGAVPWVSVSDRRLKHDVVTIPDALNKVMQLRGVNFLWNDPTPGMEGLQMGFIGQEAESVVPEVVLVKNDHYSMQYAPITALLVEALKQQQKQIDSQKQEIDDLKAMVKELIAAQGLKSEK